MQNQHQTLPLFSFAMYPDETRRYVQLDELINSGVSRTFIPTNKAHKRHCVSEQRGRTQSQGLTDEFMCALINWFTQRLSHVDITLVQGLIVDFCYDKLLTEDWKRRYRFSFALRKNSLVGYDSLMKNSPKKTKLRFVLWKFWQRKVCCFFSPLAHSIPTPMGHDLLRSAVVESRFRFSGNRSYSSRQFSSSCISCWKIQTLPTFRFIIHRAELKTFFLSPCIRQPRHSQGGHVIKCKQISWSRLLFSWIHRPAVEMMVERDILYKN